MSKWDSFQIENVADHIDVEDEEVVWWFYGWLDGGEPKGDRVAPEGAQALGENIEAYHAGIAARGRFEAARR